MTKLMMENGDTVAVKSGETNEQAIERWQKFMYKETAAKSKSGIPYDPEYNAAGAVRESIDDSSRKYIAENPNIAGAAAVGSGLRKVTGGAGSMLAQGANMLLPEDSELPTGDEGNREAINRDQPLADAFPIKHAIGEMAPTMLMPGGPTKQVLKEALARLGLEGAALGGATAAPGDRASGAAWGAGVNTLLGTAGRFLGGVGRGPGALSHEAQRTAMHGKRTPLGGEEPFIPLNIGGETTGKGAMTRFVYEKLMPNFQAASRKLLAQKNEMVQTQYRNMLRQAFGDEADEAIAVLKSTENLHEAVLAGKEAVKRVGSPMSHTRNKIVESLEQASQHADEGNPSFTQIGRSSKAVHGKDANINTPLVGMSQDTQKVLKSKVSEGNLGNRKLVYSMLSKFPIAANLTMRAMATEAVQNYMVGNTVVQRQFQNAMAKGHTEAAMDIIIKAARMTGVDLMTSDNAQRTKDAGEWTAKAPGRVLKAAVEKFRPEPK